MSGIEAAVQDDSAGYIAQWLANEPEMETALLFAGRAPRAALWGATLDQWLRACFTLSNPEVARVKLSWWGEALATATAQSPHPLVRALAIEMTDEVAPRLWQAVAEAALDLSGLDTLPADVPALVSSRLPLACALAEVEAALWPASGSGDIGAIARSLVIWQWRHHRRDSVPQPGWLPLQLLARHGLRASAVYEDPADAAARPLFNDLAKALLDCPCGPAGPILRRARTRLDTFALTRLQRGHADPFPHSGLGVLWHGWRAAHGVRG